MWTIIFRQDTARAGELIVTWPAMAEDGWCAEGLFLDGAKKR